MKKINEKYISKFNNSCVGCFDPYYVQAIITSTGKSKLKLSFRSKLLDELNVYDLAELENSYLGQINTITVSSFCGINGIIWGYDIYPSSKLRGKFLFNLRDYEDNLVNVYSAKPLILAAKLLFGNRKTKRFNLIHGSIVPCAQRKIFESGPKNIYGALALGIADDREKNADLIMEDIGIMKSANSKREEELILKNLAQSILVIGENHNVRYKEIFVNFESLKLDKGEMGCILLIAPYFKIAKNAILDDQDLYLEDWNQEIEQKIASKTIF